MLKCTHASIFRGRHVAYTLHRSIPVYYSIAKSRGILCNCDMNSYNCTPVYAGIGLADILVYADPQAYCNAPPAKVATTLQHPLPITLPFTYRLRLVGVSDMGLALGHKSRYTHNCNYLQLQPPSPQSSYPNLPLFPPPFANAPLATWWAQTHPTFSSHNAPRATW